jgi:iron complex outermembrane receptor protein
MKLQEECKIVVSCAAAVVLAGVFVTASAQTAQTQAVDPTSGLTEIIVTAQKRTESIQQIPFAITAISAERLQAENANGLEDYFREVPGLSLAQGSQGTNQLTIRGVNSSVFTGPTVGIYIDETPIGTSVAGDHANLLVPDLDPSDIDHIEVLRGPQGTLYGASTIGGLLKYVTASPSLHEASGRIEADATNVDHGGYGYVFRGAFTGPIVTDRLGIRISGYAERDPGFIDDPGVINNASTNQNLSQFPRKDVNKIDIYGGRIAALWAMTDQASLKLSAIYQHHKGDGQTAEDINGTTQKPLYGDLTQIASQYTGQSSNSLQVYNATLTWDLHWATLLSSTSYAQNEFNAVTDITGLVPPSPTSGFPPLGAAPFFQNFGAGYFTYPVLPSAYYTPVDLTYRTGKTTEEVRLTSPSSGFLDWQVGFFYTHENTTGLQNISINDPSTGAAYTVTGLCLPPATATLPPPFNTFPPCFASGGPIGAPPGTPLHSSSTNTGYLEYAGFGDATYHVTSQFSVDAGLRYSSNQQNTTQSFNGVIDLLSSGAFSGNTTSKFSGHDVTYMVSPKYQISGDVMVYGRFSTGYRPGGSNNAVVPTTPGTFKPDTTDNYEVGVKSAFDEGRIVLNASVFLIDWRDIQLLTTDPLGDGYFVNGRTARSKGVEIEASVRPIDRLLLRASAAYDEATLTDAIPAAAGTFGSKGDRLPYSPKVNASLSADYSFPVASGWTGHVGGAYQYVGDELDNFYPCSPATSGCATPSSLPPPRARLASYGVAHLRAGVTADQWQINLFVKNLTDKRAFTQESVQHATSPSSGSGLNVPDSATMITPRTIGIALVRKF